LDGDAGDGGIHRAVNSSAARVNAG
jgi:hypothetical protein